MIQIIMYQMQSRMWGRLIQNKGDVSMDEVRLSEGKAFISGNLNVDILYVGEENQKVSSLGANCLLMRL